MEYSDEKVHMISTKQKTIALFAIAIAAVLVLFASAPLVATHQAQAYWGRYTLLTIRW